MRKSHKSLPSASCGFYHPDSFVTGILVCMWTFFCGIKDRAVRTIRVRWPDGSQVHEFDFKAWGARNIVRYIDRKHRYAGNFANDGASRVMHDDAQRAQIREAPPPRRAVKILKRQEKKCAKAAKAHGQHKITDDEYENVRADAESWRQMALCVCARGVACARLNNVPELVEDHVVWHDA